MRPQGLRRRRDFAILEAGSYDAALVDAFKHFQLRHGLDANGSVGPQALRALNVPVAVRFKQLEASLERLLGMDFVFAEIRSRLFPMSAKSAEPTRPLNPRGARCLPRAGGDLKRKPHGRVTATQRAGDLFSDCQSPPSGESE